MQTKLMKRPVVNLPEPDYSTNQLIGDQYPKPENFEYDYEYHDAVRNSFFVPVPRYGRTFNYDEAKKAEIVQNYLDSFKFHCGDNEPNEHACPCFELGAADDETKPFYELIDKYNKAVMKHLDRKFMSKCKMSDQHYNSIQNAADLLTKYYNNFADCGETCYSLVAFIKLYISDEAKNHKNYHYFIWLACHKYTCWCNGVLHF